jgi:hypothetical protein
MDHNKSILEKKRYLSYRLILGSSGGGAAAAAHCYRNKKGARDKNEARGWLQSRVLICVLSPEKSRDCCASCKWPPESRVNGSSGHIATKFF